MPFQNRVTPFSKIEISPAKGMFTGNRGILHNENRELVCGTWKHKNWIVCSLEYRGIRRQVMTGRTWTELFFLDEAVAFAAGHRPCAECLPHDYRKFRDAWQHAHSETLNGARPSAKYMDEMLHSERVDRIKGVRTVVAKLKDLPSGAFVAFQDSPQTAWLVHENKLRKWEHNGYNESLSVAPDTELILITPPSIVKILTTGTYRLTLHGTINEI